MPDGLEERRVEGKGEAVGCRYRNFCVEASVEAAIYPFGG